ncbi:MAG: LysM peptidoglycan-binding domain-containing protein [Myxococcota bacterium]|nr:LysM peptidoglycan-binding domain-containing protein [Myxococcota bacterium]MEC8382294.1 LysM peptidoglycan-binding domain-containing protein [Myxococcota bacterium]
MNKARFDVENSGFFEVQYNPENFKVDRSASWKESEDQGTLSGLEFQKLAPATISMELTFDTTIAGDDVRTAWVNRLVDTLQPKVRFTAEEGQGQGQPLEKVRPPKVTFTWGDFSLEGVTESLSVTYLMFSETGVPLRAKASVKMKEFKTPEGVMVTGGGQGYVLPKVQMVQVQQGQTLSMIAAMAGTTAQVLADMNGIANPLDLSAGTMLQVPNQ